MGPGRRGVVVVVSGPSGVGKTTVCDRLVESGDVVLSVSATTRRPRPGEREGEDYFFVDEATFQRRIEAGELLEWARVHGHTLYGTPKAEVLRHLEAGRNVLLNIDVQGAEQLRGQDLPLVTIFLEPPSMAALQQRLERRGDTDPAEVARRLANAAEEMAQADRYDHRVVNDDLAATVRRIRAILRDEAAGA